MKESEPIDIENKLQRIKKLVSDVHDTNGIIKEISINNVSKKEIKELRKRLGFKCFRENLGYFSYMIKYTQKNANNVVRKFFAV